MHTEGDSTAIYSSSLAEYTGSTKSTRIFASRFRSWSTEQIRGARNRVEDSVHWLAVPEAGRRPRTDEGCICTKETFARRNMHEGTLDWNHPTGNRVPKAMECVTSELRQGPERTPPQKRKQNTEACCPCGPSYRKHCIGRGQLEAAEACGGDGDTVCVSVGACVWMPRRGCMENFGEGKEEVEQT